MLLLFAMSAAGQQNNRDSLKQALKTAQSDSAIYSITSAFVDHYLEVNWDSALYYIEKCIAISQRNNKKLEEALCIDKKGYILMHLNMPPESYKCFLAAIKIAEDPLNENKTWIIDTSLTPRKIRLSIFESIHHDFGHLLRNIGKIDEQIFHYNEAKRIAQEIGDTAMLAFVNMNMGIIYLKLGKLDSALTMEENAARSFIQGRDTRYLSEVYVSIGSIFLKKNNRKQALQFFYKGIQTAIENNNFTELSDCYSSLADYYLTTEKNKDSSLYYSQKTISVLKSMELHDLGNAFSNLSASFELNNMVDSAYKYKKLAAISNDSTYKAEIASLTKVQSMTFDEQLKLKELDDEKAATKNKIRMYALLAGLVVFFIIGLLLYRNNRQKQKANEVLATTLNTLKATQSQLIQAEKMASLGELTAGIAHEIQNPLNFVTNFSEVNAELIAEMQDAINVGNLQEAKTLANDVASNEQKINHHGKRADAIVKGMLLHSRSNTGIKEPTDINALADEYLRLAYHGLRAKDKTFNATMHTDFDKTIGIINIIPQDIGRVILNLITNAFYVVNEKKKSGIENYEPTVSVSTKKVGDKVLISVRDDGNGIPSKILDKIFQPFFTTKPTGQGTGLGLSLSYDIVKAHNGELNVETMPGEGSVFTIQLPKN